MIPSDLKELSPFALKELSPIFQNLVFSFMWKSIIKKMSISNFSWIGSAILILWAILYFRAAYALLYRLIMVYHK